MYGCVKDRIKKFPPRLICRKKYETLAYRIIRWMITFSFIRKINRNREIRIKIFITTRIFSHNLKGIMETYNTDLYAKISITAFA